MSFLHRVTFGSEGRPPITELGAGAASFYDTDRRIFGFIGGDLNGPAGLSGQVWEYNPRDVLWTERQPIGAMDELIFTESTYDPVTKRAYIFGGADELVVFADHLEYNPASPEFKVLSPANPPAARALHQMTYDSDRAKHVMFGGIDVLFVTLLSELQEYDSALNSWELVAPNFGGIYHPTGPVARIVNHQAYDPTRGLTVIHGGSNQAGDSLDDTWLWDGTGYRLQVSAQAPSALFSQNGNMGFCPAIGKIVMVGTDQTTTPIPQFQVWTLDENGWNQIYFEPTATLPSERRGPTVLTDDIRRLILFSGSTPQTTFNDLWALDMESLEWTEALVGFTLDPSHEIGSPFDPHYVIDNGLRAFGSAPFSTTQVKVIEQKGFRTKGIESIDAIETIPANTLIRYNLEIDGVEYVSKIDDWIVSDGSGATSQTSGLNALQTHLPTAPIDPVSGSLVRLIAWIETNDDAVAPILSEFTFVSVGSEQTVDPSTCVVFGTVRDANGPVEGAAVRVSPTAPESFIAGQLVVGLQDTVFTNSDGFWELTLFETETLPSTVDFEISYTGPNGMVTEPFAAVTIPETERASLESLVT